MVGTPTSNSISTRQVRIAELAKQMPTVALRTLSHHMDQEWFREAYRRTRKDGATGIDGQTGASYAQGLDDNLRELENRAKSGTYRAPPVRRVYIPKGKGKQRPIGVPTFEDKVLQRAVHMVLEPLYEQDFYDCSYGFRPGRSAHQALEVIDQWLYRNKGGWVLDVDVSLFFRQSRPRETEGDARPAGVRWGDSTPHRQVAPRGGAGGRSGSPLRIRKSARGRDFAIDV